MLQIENQVFGPGPGWSATAGSITADRVSFEHDNCFRQIDAAA